MEAVILVGGLGTRLRPYTWVLPKPLLPLGEITILEITLRRLAKFGFKKVTLSIGHKASLVKSVVSELQGLPFEVTYLEEQRPLGTAGFLYDFVASESKFLVMNGDLLTDLNLKAVVDLHDEMNHAASIISIKRTEKIDYGVLMSDDEGFLEKYDEKPTIEYLVSSGIYVFSSGSIPAFDDKASITMPEILIKMKAFGGKVKLSESHAYWMDLGRPDDYHKAVIDFESNKSRFLDV